MYFEIGVRDFAVNRGLDLEVYTGTGVLEVYIKLLVFGEEPSSVSQIRNGVLCKPSFEPNSIN